MFNTHTDIMELLCLKYLNKLREQVGDIKKVVIRISQKTNIITQEISEQKI